MQLGSKKNRVSHFTRVGLLYTILIIASFSMLAPFFWMISTSLKIDKEIFSIPPLIFPKEKWDFGNYVEVIKALNLGRAFFVSTLVTVSRVVCNCLFCSMAAYAFSRLRFPGRNILFLLVLSTLMIPFQIIVIPLFVLVSRFPLIGGNNLLGQGGSGLINTYGGLILPQAATAFGIFLMRQFMLTIPEDLRDAAKIDGASELYTFWRIILPLCTPIISTLAILTFLSAWNEFLWPLVITNTASMRVVQVAIVSLREQYTTDWALLMAGSTMATIPVLVVFLFGQKYFIKSIALTGIKQ